ncbi:MAG: DNA primase [Acidobacteria bacterium]|nr:DNA primase [Acidobacteriota bacterium]
MGWPRTFIDEVRRTAEGVRLIGEVVSLKKRGNRWVGLCPFHQEKTPSFGVNDDGLWYCFGCSEGGDIFKFFMQYDGIDFAQAVRTIAERSGVTVPEMEASSRPRREDGVPRERVMQVLVAAATHYEAALRSEAGAGTREYLTGRGLDSELVQNFGLGFAAAGWDNLERALAAQGYQGNELEASGLVKSRGDSSGVYDLLRERVVFPIRDARRRPIAFGGRVMGEGEPKYLNTPETSVFHKSRTLYGLGEARDAIRQRGYVLLVEGYLDVLACVQHGFANVVAPLGTAFTADHAKLLGRQASKAVIAFDGDTAGRAAAERTVGVFLPAGFQVSVLQLPVGEDPDSYLQAHGADGLAGALRQASPALGFLVDRAGERGDLKSPQGKAQALASLLSFVLRVENRIERAEWIGRIADALRLDKNLVARSFDELSRRPRRDPAGPEPEENPLPRVAAKLGEVPIAERRLLQALLHQPEWLTDLESLLDRSAVRDPRVSAAIDALVSLVADGATPVSAQQVLEIAEVEQLDVLLSRLTAEEDEVSLSEARGCALAIRRSDLLRQLDDLRREIQQAESQGADQLDELQQRHIALGQQIAELRRREQELAAS